VDDTSGGAVVLHNVDTCYDESSAIAALTSGDTGALAALVVLHQSHALRIAYGITRDRDVAEDVVADAFIRALQRIHHYDRTRPFRPWFHRIVVNRALDALADNDRRGGGRLSTSPLPDEADPLPLPETLAIRREVAATVSAAVDALPPPQRAVVVLRYYLDLDERSIAETLGCPVGTVKWRLFAARHRLRHSLRAVEGTELHVNVKEESPDAI
jgi:RNA polymerase sigma-70 factor (ECF subfamily)